MRIPFYTAYLEKLAQAERDRQALEQYQARTREYLHWFAEMPDVCRVITELSSTSPHALRASHALELRTEVRKMRYGQISLLPPLVGKGESSS